MNCASTTAERTLQAGILLIILAVPDRLALYRCLVPSRPAMPSSSLAFEGPGIAFTLKEATYGLRWDVDFAPSSAKGASISAVTGFNLSDLSQLALAPTGTRAFTTRYGNVAPRLGVAYQLSQSQDRATVVRGGFGVFYDLAISEVGNLLLQTGYPFKAMRSCSSPSNPSCPCGGL